MARQPYFRLVKYYRDVRGWIPAESRFDYEAQPGVYQCFTNRTRGTDLDEAWPMADNLCGFVQWVYHGIPIWTHSHSNGKLWYAFWNFECPEMPIVQALIICCIIYCKHNPVAQPLTGTMQRGSQRDRHKRNILDDLVFASMIMGVCSFLKYLDESPNH